MTETDPQEQRNDHNHAYYWTDDRGRAYVGDSEDIVQLSKLIAYAEYGDTALEADHVHHALAATGVEGIEPIHVDAPRFLVPLDQDAHRQLHADGGHSEDDIPLLLPDSDDSREPKPSDDSQARVAAD
jgi:hypothetical protein